MIKSSRIASAHDSRLSKPKPRNDLLVGPAGLEPATPTV